MNIFKMPKLPTSPVVLKKDRREVSKEDLLRALSPMDVGLTRGGGPLGYLENMFRVKEHEGPILATHAFLHMEGNTIAEENWPKAKMGLPGDKYLGGKRHTVYFRFIPMEVWQLAGAAAKVSDIVKRPTPYSGLQILGFLPEFLGGKPASDMPGMMCIEMVANVLRSQNIPFVGNLRACNMTPTDAMTSLCASKDIGWVPVAESVQDRFFLAD